MDYGLLGELLVLDDEAQIAIGGPRQRSLLALLLLNANRTVSQETIVEQLWAPSSLDAAQKNVKVAVSRLRSALRREPRVERGEATGARADGPIHTREHGYVLVVADGALDTVEFERELAAGRAALGRGEHQLARGLLRGALARWRGPALAEFRDQAWASDEAQRLEGLRMDALEARLAAELQLGEHGAVVAELEAFVAAHPERERLVGQLMVALYRCGRQVEALAAYRRARSHLVEEYGLEPGQDLAALHHAILTHEPSLQLDAGPALVGAAPAPVALAPTAFPPRLRAHPLTAFVGRGRERDALREALVRARGGAPQAVFVSGEPGIGKTRLVTEFAVEAHAAGALVTAGRCDHALGLPYQPFLEVLDQTVVHTPAEVIEDQVREHGGVLARIVPRLGGATAPRPSVSGGEGEHYRLFAAVADLLAARSQEAPLVIVLEDLHWADAATVLLLRHVLGTSGTGQLIVIGTLRSTDLPAAGPLAELLSELHRESGVERIELEALEEGEVIALVEALTGESLGSDGRRVGQRLRRETGGNPFFLGQLVQARRGRDLTAGEEEPPEPGETALPLGLRETIVARVTRVGPRAREVLDAAAVIGEEFELALLRRVTTLPEDELLAIVESAVAARLVVDAPPAGLRLQFVHGLVPGVLYGELSSGRRRLMHRRVAEAIEVRYGPAGGAKLAALAHHWREGCEPPDVGPALRCTRVAAERALVQLAPDEAVRWYTDALLLHDQQAEPGEAERCELEIALGDAQRQAGRAAFRETLLTAARRAVALGDRERLVRATLANTRGFTSATGEIDTERVEMIEAALAAIGDADTPERARLLAAHAVELAFSRRREAPQVLSDEALAVAGRVGEDAATAQVLTMRFFAIWTPDTLPQRLAESAETVEICERLDDQVAHVHALHWRAAACLEAGDMVAARRCVEHESELAQRVRQPAALWLAAYNETNLAIALGRLAEADELAPQALALGQRSDQPDALAVFAAQLASLRFEQGRLGELLPLIERVLEEHPGITGFRALRALGHCEVGDHAGARKAIELDRGSDFAELAYDVTWSSVVCIYAHVCARLGERDAARTLYRLLAPWHDQVPLSVVAWGCVSHYLGMLATALREFPSATEHLAHAANVHRRMGTPVWAARTKLETARLLAAEGGRGSGPRSRNLAEQALAAARELGCATIARDAEALIGDTGVHAVHT